MENKRLAAAEDTITSAPSVATYYHTGNFNQYLTRKPHELNSGKASIATLQVGYLPSGLHSSGKI